MWLARTSSVLLKLDLEVLFLKDVQVERERGAGELEKLALLFQNPVRRLISTEFLLFSEVSL